VLVDSGLPGIDALQLQHWLANLGSHLPVILLSGRDAMRNGAFDLVEKPVNPARLPQIVHAGLQRDRQSRARRPRVAEKMGVQSLPDLVRILLQCDDTGGLPPEPE
jgi:FixJ family two-component response regulator